MTAVDQAGTRLSGIGSPADTGAERVEITVQSAWTLTEELALAIAISAPWLSAYFELGGG